MSKPHIEHVFEAVNTFSADLQKMMRDIPPSGWVKKADELRAELRKKFEAWGIADHIDWRDPRP